MATFKRFEDILAWQKAREITKLAYRLSNGNQFSKDFGLRDQLRRASVSVRWQTSRKEFANFLNYAHGSAAECQSHLYVALDLDYLSRADFDLIFSQFDECSRMIIGLSHHLRKT